MNIVCATDDNFVQHCCIMLVSLLINNKDVSIYVLTEGLKPENIKKIEEEVSAKQGRLKFCKVDPTIVEKFPMPKGSNLAHISRATYYRLLIPELLPSDVEKVIYLDCDMIVSCSIQKLWETDMTGYALAAVPQIGYGYEALRLGYPIEYGYFNAGMNVINMNYFREHHIVEGLIDYIEHNTSRIIYHDQDTLNAVLYDKTKHLLPMWNMTSLIYTPGLDGRGDKQNGIIINDYHLEKENAKQYKKCPPILHYVSKPKPWNKDCVHPLYHLYYDYAEQTINYKHLSKQSVFSRFPAVSGFYLMALGSIIKQRIYKTDHTRL